MRMNSASKNAGQEVVSKIMSIDRFEECSVAIEHIHDIVEHY